MYDEKNSEKMILEKMGVSREFLGSLVKMEKNIEEMLSNDCSIEENELFQRYHAQLEVIRVSILFSREF